MTLRATAAALAATALLGAAAPAAQAAFEVPALAPAARVTSADVDGDGKRDVVAANATGPEASVLRGDGQGGFVAPPVAVPFGGPQRDVAVGDFNGDGRPDVIAAVGGDVVLALQTQGGTFITGTTEHVGGTATSLIVADLDWDGHRDVAVANLTDTVVALYGNGDGTFAATRGTLLAPLSSVTKIVGAKLDVRTKIAVISRTGATANVLTFVSHNERHTPFLNLYDYMVPDGTSDLALADLNANGDRDIVTASATGGTVTELRAYNSWQHTVGQTVAAGTSPGALAAGDADGDGDADVVVADTASPPGSVSILANDGTGTLGAPGARVAYTGRTLRAVTLAEIDGDGVDDIVLGTTEPLVAAFRTRAVFAVEQSAITVGNPLAPTPVSTASTSYSVAFTNVGFAPVTPRGFAFSGPHGGDFLVGEDPCRRVMYPGVRCTIGVRFVPTATGVRTGTLSVLGPNGSGADVALTGHAGPLPAGPKGTDGEDGGKGGTGAKGDTGAVGAAGAQGQPGADGAKGDTGAAGAPGATGPGGAKGAAGPRGAAGRPGTIRLETCTVKGKKRTCSTRTLTTDVTFTASATAKAALIRRGVVYAHGTATRLVATRTIPRGRYALTLTTTKGGTRTTVRRTVVVR